MSKPPFKDSENSIAKEEAFEIIELATQDLDLLTRAFTVIADVCAQDEEVEEEGDVLEAEELHIH